MIMFLEATVVMPYFHLCIIYIGFLQTLSFVSKLNETRITSKYLTVLQTV